MTHYLKRILLVLFTVFILFVGTIALIMSFINPNDYKSDIVKAAKDKAGINLQINGDISWSFSPLGLDINKIKILDQNQHDFTDLNRLTAQVSLISLFKMKPKVQRILIDGLKLNLKKNAQGKANWTQIVLLSATQSKKLTRPSPSTMTRSNQKSISKPTNTAPKNSGLNFKINEIRITNTKVNYSDLQTGQSISLDDFNLKAKNISLNKSFPVNIGFMLNNHPPQLKLKATLSAQIKLSQNFKQVEIINLKSQYQLKGTPFSNKTVIASLDSNIAINLNNQTANIKNLVLQIANLKLNANLSISDLKKSPKIAGQLDIPPFSVQKLLKDLGQKKILTANPSALDSVGFKTTIASPAKTYTLNNIKIALDKTTYTGNLSFTPKSQKLIARINGTALNLDDYLPPQPGKANKDNLSGAVSTVEQLTKISGNKSKLTPVLPPSNPSTPLLPLKLVRALNLDIIFNQKKLIVKNIKINQIIAKIKAYKGVVQLKKISAKLYGGSVFASGKVDARTNNVKWHIVKQIKGIQLGPLLTDAATIKFISGTFNASANISSVGNTLINLRNNAKGNINFNIDNATLKGTNLNALACQGVSKLTHRSVNTSQWPAETRFNSLMGQLTINGSQFKTPQLKASVAGLTIKGSGLINLAKKYLNYQLDMYVTGNLGSNQCKVNKRIKQIPIPILCKGNFDTPPARLCGLNTGKLDKVFSAMLKSEVQKKKKQLEKKAKKRVKQFINKKLNNGVNNLLKKLF